MKKIFKTVKFKFFISATALIAATTLLCVGLNSALGQKYYFYQIKKMLLSSYSKICMLYDDAALADGQRATEIEKISANNNIHVMIFDGKTPVYSSLPRDSARFSNGENAGEEKAEKLRNTGFARKQRRKSKSAQWRSAAALFQKPRDYGRG